MLSRYVSARTSLLEQLSARPWAIDAQIVKIAPLFPSYKTGLKQLQPAEFPISNDGTAGYLKAAFPAVLPSRIHDKRQ